jgi:hypothetical protein
MEPFTEYDRDMREIQGQISCSQYDILTLEQRQGLKEWYEMHWQVSYIPEPRERLRLY